MMGWSTVRLSPLAAITSRTTPSWVAVRMFSIVIASITASRQPLAGLHRLAGHHGNLDQQARHR